MNEKKHEQATNNKIYILGAHSRARTLGIYSMYLNPDLEILAYLVTNEEENPTEIMGIPVKKMDVVSRLDFSAPVYLGTRGIYHATLTRTLQDYGFTRIVPVTPELDIDLRNLYLEKYLPTVGRSFIRLEDLSSEENKDSRRMEGESKAKTSITACVYVASSIHDGVLQTAYEIKEYEKVLQVGAALTDKRIVSDGLTDFSGMNISEKNVQFCELTALYWMAYNATEDVVGLAHYRRHFLLPSDWTKRMEINEIDVILPTPLYVGPSIAENYMKRHSTEEWSLALSYIRARSEEEYGAAQKFFAQTLYSPCNMFIMRREVLKDFADWLFPLLFSICDKVGTKQDPYQNRYPGFLSERLLSFYFEYNKNRLKVAYTDKNFLQ